MAFQVKSPKSLKILFLVFQKIEKEGNAFTFSLEIQNNIDTRPNRDGTEKENRSVSLLNINARILSII